MKKSIILLASICIQSILMAQSEGPNNPGAATEAVAGCLSCPGGDWTNFSNVYTNDNMNATANVVAFPSCFQSACFYSKDLYAHNFGFTVPLNATINGIIVEIKKNSGAATTTFPLRDSVVSLITAPSNLVGLNKSSITPWPGISNYSTYGGNTDLWGTTWTPAQIDSSGFGVALKVRNVSNAQQVANVDHIRITVYYTNAVGIAEIQTSDHTISVYPNPAASSLNIFSADEKIEFLKCYDVLGKSIIEHQFEKADHYQEVDLQNIAKGIYFVLIKTKTGSKTLKFIKE